LRSDYISSRNVPGPEVGLRLNANKETDESWNEDDNYIDNKERTAVRLVNRISYIGRSILFIQLYRDRVGRLKIVLYCDEQSLIWGDLILEIVVAYFYV
jgi:hypothetical protein